MAALTVVSVVPTTTCLVVHDFAGDRR